MAIILNKLLFQPKEFKVDMPTYSFSYFQINSFFFSVIAMILLSVFNFSSLVILIGGLAVYYYFYQKEEGEFLKKLNFLNELMYDGAEEPFDMKSYLNLNPQLMDFFYRTQYYIEDNLTAYRKALVGTNYILRQSHNFTQKLMRDPEQQYQLAFMESKNVMNEFQSLIHKIVSHQVNYDLFNDNLATLEKLLKEQMQVMKKQITCGYNLYDLNIWSLPNPSNLEDENDMKDKYYSPNYSFY